MSEEKSSIEVLADFAKSTGRKFFCNDNLYNNSLPNRYPKYRSNITIFNNNKSQSYFISFWGSLGLSDINSCYSGFFLPVTFSKEDFFIIRKRNFLDNFSLFSRNKSYKTGNMFFDSKVFVEGNFSSKVEQLIFNQKFQDIVIKVLNIKQTAKISLNAIKVDFVSELNERVLFSVYDTQQWFLDAKTIEELFVIIDDFNAILDI